MELARIFTYFKIWETKEESTSIFRLEKSIEMILD